MKILHITTSDSKGGAAKSAYRIHKSLLSKGIESKMLVGRRSKNEAEISSTCKYSISMYLKYALSCVQAIFGLQYLWIPSKYVLNHPWLIEADIVHIYNLHGGYISIDSIAKIKKPIVVRFSDMWYFTGHCSYPGDCDGWIRNCEKCTDLGSYPPIGIDTAKYLYENKRKIYKSLDAVYVAPSSWIKNIAERSDILGGKHVHLINNSANEHVFYPDSTEIKRKEKDSITILCVAHGFDDNPRKGLDFFIRALEYIDELDVVEIIVDIVGECERIQSGFDKIIINKRGYVHHREIREYYLNADLVVIPSLEDNLPNVVLESMACGKPIVANDVGGIKDAVIHGVNGYLSDPSSPKNLSDGIISTINKINDGAFSSSDVHNYYMNNLSNEIEINKYISLYSSMLV